MNPQILAALILLPFALAFLYAAVHEFRRFRSEGKANYGLVYNEETGTTHVTGIEDGEDGFDPEEFDPNDYNDPELNNTPDAVEEDDEGQDTVENQESPGDEGTRSRA